MAGQIAYAVLASSESLSALSQQAAAILLGSLWQGALIAAALALCLLLMPHSTASHRFRIWSAAFILLAALPLLPLLMGWVMPSHPAGFAAGRTSWFVLDPRWAPPIALFWAAGSLYRAADLLLHSLRLRRIWKDAAPLASSLNPALQIPGRRHVQLCTTTDLERPGVIGFFAPRILIPNWLFESLTDSELDQIVLHETEHLRRGDDWTNLLQKCCLVFFPLNPALLWIERRLCREREMACDEGVIRRTHAPRAYAACLASLAERGLHHRAALGGALSLGIWQRRPELAQRVHSILLGKRTLGPLRAAAMLGAIGCGLIGGAVELSRCPQLVSFAPTGSDTQISKTVDMPNSREIGERQVIMTPVKAVLSSKKYQIASPARVDRQAHAAVAELGKIESKPQEQEAQQRWIVLTAWEEVGNLPTPLQSDEESGEAGQTAAPPAVLPQMGQKTLGVTRLIFRVVPGTQPRFASPDLTYRNSGSPRSVPPPPIVSLPGGWIVFQL